MSEKLEVVELRAQLELRGLESTGTKRTLVRRLDAALSKEEEKVSREALLPESSVGSKRKTRSSDGGEAERVDDVDIIRKMGIRELREQAAMRGIPTNGLKGELVERLSAHVDKDGKDLHEELAVTEEKLVTATKKGNAVLDQWLPEHIKSSYHVLQKGKEIYDAILNQTNVGDNNNKFYAIQVLVHGLQQMGRVGIKGQDKLFGPFLSRETAINDFEMKFFAKTKNQWSNRRDFISYPKHYTWLEMDYNEANEHTEKSKTDDTVITTQLRETKLDLRTADFMSLICNISMMKQQMVEIGYNAEKLPLGKISRSTILKGYDVLRKISNVIGKSDRKELERLSGEFYTVIPHNFGFKKMSLGEIEIASKILKDDINSLDDPLFWHYQQLHCEMTPLEVDSKEFLMIEKYILNTHAKTHSNYTVDIVHIFKVARLGEIERFKKFAMTKNRMLLWHGSRMTNWIGILSQGLRIAPPEAPSTGYMFGKGVYFADMFSKSANYCFATPTFIDGVLLLCEVALGDMEEKLSGDYNADQLPEGKSSTKGVGATEPDPSEFDALHDGAIVPLGRPRESSGPKGILQYNEYIVYNVDQILMRYVVHVNFRFNA
ncbi:unnamed protein product [Spirodela intermedia]|uniref:Poly [ADP-ribose] polymerase n=1 Tax=Spirodela intermedia TaxID=51605 RepID=A0A7I8IW52_SPIIN|nr:unnamed protein product [Spirodela intermedia]CAA6662039.1 unnamed protein product [Spirodela intermedia]